MCTSPFRKLLATAAAVLLIPAARAADTDIYVGADATNNNNPNVMIVLDNSSNWSGTFANSAPSCSADNTKFCNEVAALRAVIAGLNDRINVGLAMFAETGTNGAYVRFAARPMNDTNKTKLLAILAGLIRNGSGTDSSGSNQPYAAAMFEMFKYYGGYTYPALASSDTAGSPVGATGFGPTAYAGGNSNNAGTYRRDYRNNPRNDSAGNLDGNALGNSASNTYNSPISSACQKNFIIFVSNGNPSVGGDTVMTGSINANVRVDTTQINPPNHASTFDEWARYLNQTDVSSYTGQQNVSTFTIAVYDPQNNCTVSATNNCASNSDNNMIKLMASGAKVGGGSAYTAVNYQELVTALRETFVTVQSVNSVFASASLPVSVNTQGTYLNQVFIGMFRPDGSGLPRWAGNLKQFKFAKDTLTGDVSMIDQQALLVINPATGFITGCSKSFWTSDGGVDYWGFLSAGKRGTCTSTGTNLLRDTPDGEVVEKGGAAQRLRQFSTASPTSTTDFSLRKLYTLDGSNNMVVFGKGSTSLTAAGLATTAAGRDDLIDWIRGRDSDDENNNSVLTEMRPYVHGDVVHSRPLALDYGGTTGVVVFYGDNLGVYHAITGAQTSTGGSELWGFVPPECYTLPSRIRLGEPLVDYWNGANPYGVSPAPTAKPYCMDGGTGVYKNGATTWIYPSMRRGGRTIYSFNVTDIANTTPTLKWRLTQSSPGMSGTSPTYSLGYTWSTPKVAILQGLTSPYVLFGGGYDTCEDQDAVPNTSCSTTPMGNAIYVVDANTGALVKAFTHTSMRSVPSDLTLVDNDGDGKADIAYAVDIRGNLFRIDFVPGTSASPTINWTIKRIAALGDNVRKFLYSPEVVRVAASGTNPGFYGIALGSGDREHPRSSNAAYNVVNRFYFIKDPGTIADSSPITDDMLTDVGQQGGTLDPNPTINQYGWKTRLRTGEQVVTTPVVVGGLAYFSTNRPVPYDPSTCTNNLGEARGYALNFLTGVGTSKVFVGGGLPPSPVVAMVDLGGDLGTVLTCIGCISDSNNSAIGSMRPPINVPKTRKRVWWYESAD